VRYLRIDEANIKRIDPQIAAEFSRTFLTGGELVITVRGSLGGVAVVPARMRGYNVSREVAVIPVKNDFVGEFFCFAIGSLQSQNMLTGVEKGVAYTGINIEDLKRLPLPVPPLAEQREIVLRVEKLFKLADAIEKRVTVGTARAEKLTQAILAKAFRGELVPTEAELARQEGRRYESAADLLKRIQTGTTAESNGKPTKPAKKPRGERGRA
jgi:type I restriction enzyme S subunit